MGLSGEVHDLSFEDRLDRRKGRSVRGRSAGARFTEDELKLMDTAAGRDGKLFAEWAREVLLREARSARGDALFTEIIATRMLLNLVLKTVACGEEMSAEQFSGVLSHVRTTKHQAAADVKQQYVSADERDR